MAELIKFKCRTVAGSGEVVEKVLEAESKSAVIEMIRRAGDMPARIEVFKQEGSKDVASLKAFQRKIKSKDLALFCKQMHTMLHAGMPLIKALGVMSEQLQHKLLKQITRDMMEDVQKGSQFHEAMRKHEKYFPSLLINMVESGEMTGKQDEVLEKMALYFEKEDRIEKKIKGAMVYPKFLGVLTVVVVIIMLAKVLPMFVQIFADGGAELPWITKFVIACSDFVVQKWYILIGIVAAAVLVFKSFVRTPSGRRSWHSFLLKLPVVGTAIKKIITSRFTRTLSTLLGSGLPLLNSLELAGRVTGNVIVQDRIDSITEDIKKGSALSSLIKKVEVFPPMLISMVTIGEESGALEDMLERTSDFYDQELEAAMTQLVGLVEPVMILAMGIVIGFIVVAMLLPMFTLFTAFQDR